MKLETADRWRIPGLVSKWLPRRLVAETSPPWLLAVGEDREFLNSPNTPASHASSIQWIRHFCGDIFLPCPCPQRRQASL